MEILIVAARAGIVYIFIIFAIRLFGKKELTQLSVLDLVFILLISNSVQNAMVGSNTSLIGGIAAASGLFILNLVLDNVFFRSSVISRIIQGSPLMLIYHGKLIESHLRQARITKDEIEAAVREHGVEEIDDVDLAVLETDGNISVLSHDFKKRTSRRRKAHKAITKES